MLTRVLTTRLAIVAAVIAVGGCAYGVVNSTSSSGSGTASAASGSAAQRMTGSAPAGGSASQKVGKFPANYREGSGTIVSGTTATKATEAALTAYPGGVVDRVVKLSLPHEQNHISWRASGASEGQLSDSEFEAGADAVLDECVGKP
jgi:hypothetical protein